MDFKYVVSTSTLYPCGMSQRLYKTILSYSAYGSLFAIIWHEYGDYVAPELIFKSNVYKETERWKELI